MMRDVLEALLFPIVAVFWALQWPLSDEGFSLLFLLLLVWQGRRGHVALWEKKDNLRDQSPAQTPALHAASFLHQHHLKNQLEDTSDKVWTLDQERTEDPEEVLGLLKRHDTDTVCGELDCTIRQHLSEEAQGVSLEGGAPCSVLQPPTEKVTQSGLPCYQDPESGTHHSQETASRPNDCKLAQYVCGTEDPPPTRDEGPQTPQLEKTHQQENFPPSALSMSEDPKEEAHKDTEKTPLGQLLEPVASLVGTEPCCRPSLLCPKTRSLLEEHLKSMLHIQKSRTQNWVLEAQSPLASQAGELDVQPSALWRKGSALTEDFLRINTPKRDKEAPKCHQISFGEIPSVVPGGQGDTRISSPRAPPAPQGPSALPGPGSSSTATSSSLKPGQRFTSTLTLRLKPRPREDGRLLVKLWGLPESSIKSLESVLQRKYVDFLSGFCQLYDIAMSIAVSPAAVPWMPASTEVKPTLDRDCSERSVIDELKQGKSEEPKLTPIAECQETPPGSRLRRHSKVTLDRSRLQSQPAWASGQESQGLGQQVSRRSKSSLCPRNTTSSSGTSTVIQSRKKAARRGHGGAPFSALETAGSCGPGVSIPGPARANKGSQPPPKATFSEKLKTWFSSLGQRWQERVGPGAPVIVTLREPGKLRSASPENTKLPFSKGLTHLRHGFSAPMSRRPRPAQPQISYSDHIPRPRHRAP
ncbi:uncharacterized protein LOC119932481 [Tachyglossus aculeatus]|uniref:uncharacterized protein LOC119932481 n=1 Tax=Tachyglossus aculeatus TaxID=9261 RepID=UPI0018F3082D|nr:uncharacterized protein LOC119932481 [Tachyglossus aculeatus]